jgi:hypothetical protein
MRKEIKDEVNKIVSQIPERNRLAIKSVDWEDRIEKISKLYYLENEDMDLVLVETALVLLGINETDTFRENLEDLGLSEIDLNGLVLAITNQIFNPISKKIIASIKKEAELNNTSWDKRVNFILSGGDYTNFIK